METIDNKIYVFAVTSTTPRNITLFEFTYTGSEITHDSTTTMDIGILDQDETYSMINTCEYDGTLYITYIKTDDKVYVRYGNPDDGWTEEEISSITQTPQMVAIDVDETTGLPWLSYVVKDGGNFYYYCCRPSVSKKVMLNYSLPLLMKRHEM